MMIRKLILAGALGSGLVLTAGGAAFASASQHPQTPRPAAATHVKAAEPAGENSGEQEGSTQGDGPGGHADQPGQNVDHQFTGTE